MILRKEGIIVKLKKIIAITTLAIVMATSTSAMSITANAANTSNKNFSIALSTNAKRSSSTVARLKQDSTSSYVNYKVKADGSTATGPAKFYAYIYGGTSSSNLVDASSYTPSGVARKKAVVTKGTKGYIIQYVYEIFGYNAYTQIYGRQYSTYTGTAKGCWSPDSVSESGTTTYN